jgi:competence protein ComEC
MFRNLFIQFVIFVVFGLVSFYQLSQPIVSNDLFYYLAPTLIILTLIIIIQRLLKINWLLVSFIGWILGFSLVSLHWHMQTIIEDSFFNQPVQVEGTIISLPSDGYSMFGAKKSKFLFKVNRIQTKSNKHSRLFTLPPVIELSWYEGKKDWLPEIKTGQIWCLPVKLKPIHASMNPSAFDYEQYLFTENIVARGYVNLNYGQTELIDDIAFSVRFWLSNEINKLFKTSEFNSLFNALLIGDKSKINNEQWALLQQTGTIHLMAISGLHIGIMAMIGYISFGLLWRVLIRFSATIRSIPKVIFSSVAVLFLITFYLYISGAAVSTQRAWIMAVVLILLLFLRRKFQPWSSLSLAALFVMIWQPSAVLASGFWLSFLAVALIFISLQNAWLKQRSNWQKVVVIQLVLTIGMMPILAFYYQQIPLISSLANLVAVPVVSILALPFLLLTLIIGIVFSNILPPLVIFVTKINQEIWNGLWQYLSLLTQLESPYWLIGRVEIWQLALVYMIWWLVYQSRIRIWQKLIIGLSSFLLIIVYVSVYQLDKPSKGEVKMTVLDVGQGQALVFETKNHTVIYDTGAKWGDKLDGAKLALLPYLKQQQTPTVDLLIVSHSDSDHSGGVNSLIENTKIIQMVSGEKDKLNRLTNQSRKEVSFQNCHQQEWLFDEVEFNVISNPQTEASDNDRSCVLQVLAGNQSVLVMGDVTKKIENQLLLKYGEQLESNILIAGHHGSNSSTSENWLNLVRPEVVVFSAGYGNRFGFPHQSVIKRVEKNNAQMLNTACSGAIGFTITKNNWQLDFEQRVRQQKLFHHQCTSSNQ